MMITTFISSLSMTTQANLFERHPAAKARANSFSWASSSALKAGPYLFHVLEHPDHLRDELLQCGLDDRAVDQRLDVELAGVDGGSLVVEQLFEVVMGLIVVRGPIEHL